MFTHQCWICKTCVRSLVNCIHISGVYSFFWSEGLHKTTYLRCINYDLLIPGKILYFRGWPNVPYWFWPIFSVPFECVYFCINIGIKTIDEWILCMCLEIVVNQDLRSWYHIRNRFRLTPKILKNEIHFVLFHFSEHLRIYLFTLYEAELYYLTEMRLT